MDFSFNEKKTLADLPLCPRIFPLCCSVFVVDKVHTPIGIYTFLYKYIEKVSHSSSLVVEYLPSWNYV